MIEIEKINPVLESKYRANGLNGLNDEEKELFVKKLYSFYLYGFHSLEMYADLTNTFNGFSGLYKHEEEFKKIIND